MQSYTKKHSMNESNVSTEMPSIYTSTPISVLGTSNGFPKTKKKLSIDLNKS